MKNFGASTISRKKLLGGTALVAVATALAAVSVAGSANAQSVTTRQANINSEWRGNTGNLNSAAENDNIEITDPTGSATSVEVRITQNANVTATTNVGDVTDSMTGTNRALLTIQNNTNFTTNLAVTINSVNINDNMTVSAQGGAGSSNGRKLTVNVTGTTEVKNLTIRNLTPNSATLGKISAVETTLNGNTTVNGTTNVTGGDSNSNVGSLNPGVEGATATLNLKGTTNTFNGAVKITGGSNNTSNDATINLYGNANFASNLTLEDASFAGRAKFNVVGTADQRIEGDIKGASPGSHGTLTIKNGDKEATFTGGIGVGAPNSASNRLRTVWVDGRVEGANAVFEKDVISTYFYISSSNNNASSNNASATFKGAGFKFQVQHRLI